MLSVPYENQLEIKERQVIDLFLEQDILRFNLKVLTSTVEYFNEKNVPYYRNMSHKGYLRNLVVRKGINVNEIMVNIVTSSNEEILLKIVSLFC